MSMTMKSLTNQIFHLTLPVLKKKPERSTNLTGMKSSTPPYYEDLIHSVDHATFPLKVEYENVRSLYQELVESVTHDDDEDLFDILD